MSIFQMHALVGAGGIGVELKAVFALVVVAEQIGGYLRRRII